MKLVLATILNIFALSKKKETLLYYLMMYHLIACCATFYIGGIDYLRYNSFLEKSEQLKILIIKSLLFTPHKASKKKIQTDLDLSSQTLQTYVEDLLHEINTETDFNISITETTETLTLEESSSINLNKIIYFYLKKAPKYQIILLLFYKNHVTIPDLEYSLSISRSTIYRKLIELNSDLTEFNLAIKNCSLIGSELQIRYFYFLFLTQLTPFDELILSMKNDNISKVIDELESKLDTPFNIESKTKLYTWMHIVHIRYHTNNGFNYFDDHTLIQFFEKSLFYKKIELILKPFEEGLKFIRNDTDRIYMFSMSLCFDFLPAYFSEYLKWDHSENDFSFYQLNLIISDYLNKNFDINSLTIFQFNLIRYLIIQSLFQYIFFSGYIFSYDENHFDNIATVQPDKAFIKVDKFINRLSIFIKNDIDYFTTENSSQFKNLYYHILAIFRYIEFTTEKPIKIGLRSHSEYLIQLLMQVIWTKYLTDDIPITISLHSSNQNYDLVISDYKNKHDNTQNLYIFSDLNTNFDIKKIKEKIRQIYVKKHQPI